MGAAGDMLTAALYELLDEAGKSEFLKQISESGVPGVVTEPKTVTMCGITGTWMEVRIGGEEEAASEVLEESVHGHDHGHEHSHEHDHDHEHSHSHEHSHTHFHASMDAVRGIIYATGCSDAVKERAMAVYMRIAEAESKAHGKPVTEIHFHEVGAMDAIADVINVCVLMEMIAPQKVIVSPVNVGFGQVRCAHGIMPVPAPATAHLLQGVPIYAGNFRGEMCTPTGAALLTEFADEFGRMPVMRTDAVGYGMGHREMEAPNCVRAFLGETADGKKDALVELSCNLDDMTGEEVAFAEEQLRLAGAPEVYTIPASMKKNRVGVLLTCLCRPEQEAIMLAIMMKYTTTWGVRRNDFSRYVMDRSFEQKDTPYGTVTIKSGTGYGVSKSKPEYEDLAKAAKESGESIAHVAAALHGLM